MFEQYREPLVSFVIEKHVALPAGLQQVFVGLWDFLSFHQIDVVTKHDRYDVKGSEESFLVFVGLGKKLALCRKVGINGSDLFERRCLFGGAVGDVEKMITGIQFRLNFDHLSIAGNPIRIHSYERIALLKDANEGIDLLRLQGAVEGDFTFASGLFDKSL